MRFSKLNIRRAGWIYLFAFAALARPGGLQAQSLVPLSTQQLAVQAPRIVMGHCSAVRQLPQKLLALEVTLTVDKTIKGIQSNTISFRYPGQKSPCEVGETLLVFLRPALGSHQLVGFQQGLFQGFLDANGTARLDRAGTLNIPLFKDARPSDHKSWQPRVDDFIRVLRQETGL